VVRRPIRVLRICLPIAVLALSACSGGGEAEGPTTTAPTTMADTSTEAATETTATETTPTVDPEVRRWAKMWRNKVSRPMRRAVRTLTANAVPGIDGGSDASFRALGAINKLAKCQVLVDIDLAETPDSLRRAKSLTGRACLVFFRGTNRVVDGWNAQDSALVEEGVSLVKKGATLLRKAANAVKKAESEPVSS
jgi:hypothetical protein